MSFYALFLAISHFIGCLGTEWQSCPAYTPPATIIFLLFLMFEGLLFALFTSVMFGTQVAAIWYDETVSETTSIYFLLFFFVNFINLSTVKVKLMC